MLRSTSFVSEGITPSDVKLETHKCEATLITGCVRSGTTLALRVLTPDLTVDEEIVPSPVNEPKGLTDAIRGNQLHEVQVELERGLMNRCRTLKSPHIGFYLPLLRGDFRTVVVVRDLRQIIPSMISHSDVMKYDLGASFWHGFCGKTFGSDDFAKAHAFAVSIYESIGRYHGELEVWNYGCWNEWTVRARSIKHLYSRAGQTSGRVIQDVKDGQLFSNASATLDAWLRVCEERNISRETEALVLESNERIRSLFASRVQQNADSDSWDSSDYSKRR